MTTYAILHRGDPERCIRFIERYCRDWHEDNDVAIRNFFIRMSPFALADHPYCKVDDAYYNPCISEDLDKEDTYISFEEVEGRRRL